MNDSYLVLVTHSYDSHDKAELTTTKTTLDVQKLSQEMKNTSRQLQAMVSYSLRSHQSSETQQTAMSGYSPCQLACLGSDHASGQIIQLLI